MTWFPVLPFMHFTALLIYIILIVIILSRNRNSTVNRTAAALILCFAVWSGSKILLHNPGTSYGLAVLLEKIAAVGWVSFPVFALWFLLELSENKKILGSKLFYGAIIALPAFFLMLHWNGLIDKMPVKTEFGWYSDWLPGIWPYAYYLYYLSCVIVGLVSLFFYNSRTSSRIIKKQASVVLWTSAATLAIGTFFEVLAPALHMNLSFFRDINDIYIVVWAGGFSYILYKYRFMAITSAAAAESIIASMTELLFFLDEDLNITYINSPALKFLGYQEHEIKGMPFFTILFDRTKTNAILKETLITGSFHSQEFLLRKKDGSSASVVFSISVLKELGEIRGMVCVASDISKIKQVEEEMRKDRDIIRKYLDIAEVFFLVVNIHGEIVLINKKGCDILGYPEYEVIGKNWIGNFIKPEQRETAAYVYKNLLHGAEIMGDIESPVLTKDGRERVIGWSNTVLYDDAGSVTGILSAGDDVTDTIKMQEEVIKLSTAVGQSPSSVVITDPDGTITYVNPKFSQVTGYSREETIGKNPRILKSGEWPKERYKEMWDTIVSGNEWRGEFHNKKKNGELYWESASISPIKNYQGKITSFIAIKEDITEQKKAQQELKDSYDKLKELDILKANFTSMVSHELRTPITSIKGFLAFLLSGVGGKISPQQKEFLEIIKSNSDRLLSLINDLLDTAKMESGSFSIHKTPFDLVQLINTAIKDIRSLSSRNNIEITMSASDGTIVINADDYRVSQLIINLLNNAIKFSPRASWISVEIKKTPENGITIPSYADISQLKPGPYACITISDQGTGIETDKLEKVFARYYQVEDINTRHAQGTGLGLNIVKNIAGLHGGAVWAESGGKGKGTTFKILLPEN